MLVTPGSERVNVISNLPFEHVISPGNTQKRVYALRHESIVQKVRSKH